MVRSHCRGNSNGYGKLNFFRCRCCHNANATTCCHDTHFLYSHCHFEWVLKPFMKATGTTQKIDLFCHCRLSVNEPLQGSQNISAKLEVNTKIIV